ncbi:MAG: hypothetical protein WC980_04880 [Candidatus Brocadiia bacterium]
MRIEEDSPELNPKSQDYNPQQPPNHKSGCRKTNRSEAKRFLKPLLSLTGIRYDKVMRIKALVESGRYETEDRIRRTAEHLADFMAEK